MEAVKVARVNYRHPVILKPMYNSTSVIPTSVAEEVAVCHDSGRFRMHAYLGRVFLDGRVLCAEFVDVKGTHFHVIATNIEADRAMGKLMPGRLNSICLLSASVLRDLWKPCTLS